MSSNNPSVTASDIITDVEARLGTPNISTSQYLPWVSYAYNRTFQALLKTNQTVKEELFGNLVELTLINGQAEYALSTYIPRYGGFIKGEILFGATGDEWQTLQRLPSISQWRNQNNVSTTYRSKDQPLVYFLEDTIGFIPTPPSGDAASAEARIWYVRRPYQITESTDVIDIDYRFIYPVVNYVQAKAMEKKYEDYTSGRDIENRFLRELEDIALAADSEFNENEGHGIQVSADSPLYDNPFAV